MCTQDTLLSKGELQLGINVSTSTYHTENLGKRGNSNAMSNHTLSEDSPTP